MELKVKCVKNEIGRCVKKLFTVGCIYNAYYNGTEYLITANDGHGYLKKKLDGEKCSFEIVK